VRSLMRNGALALCVAGAVLASGELAHSQAVAPKAAPAVASLEGSWSGGGVVNFASGARENARCRAHYRRASGASYTMNAVCATSSGRAAQTATLRKVGDNAYQGQFYNSEYGISGAIYVVVRGNRQSVRLTSASGSGNFTLSR
jgi:hypothetical protein